ncbi:MAG: 1,4-dihydroxy-2-naphthoate octaprenyltransferase [Bacillati bacterium ANGP1]|uniref:1,4-dihydroxy-2-naphthoate octaprenyltransferase n=1 Tax=Candidatus Segetimicrobium genomatis TaxID=2569760 RepID=A0A537K1T5_9BACT|nr:MAG: 1,4-dihydroxy-2-naphthoate octaprenyltransferase [Terrabacteria group bacterium ANGP1]
MPAGPAGLPPRTARMWAQAVRPFSFTASIVPVLLGSAIASAQGMFTPGLLALALLGAVGIQGAANLFSDYFDYRGGYDTPESFGGSGVLVRGILQPSEVFLAGLALMAASVAIGLYLTAIRGTPILLLGILGAFGAYFYSGRPIAYKYHALGDLAIFLLFGPLMALGAYYVQARVVELVPMLYALPVGCLVTAILHVNNIRDSPFDGRGGGTTVARALGLDRAKVLLYVLLAAAYGLVIGGVLAGTFVRWSALAVLSAPPAWGLARQVRAARTPRDLVLLDVAAARVHLIFGLLLVAGVLLPPV